MRQQWAAAPAWLRLACVLGVHWFLAGLAIGAPLLLEEGPGLPVIALGALGLAPWIYLVVREPRP